MTLRVAVLVLAALLPYGRVFATGDWVVPVVSAALLPIGLSWLTRRLRTPWWAALGLVAAAWLWCTARLLLPDTMWNGLLPTPTTLRVMVDAAVLGVQRIAVLPAPIYPERPVLLVAMTGVWWVAMSIDTLAARLRSPGKAVVCAITLWIVPLAILPGRDNPWTMAAPLLLASVTLLLTRTDTDVADWGRLVRPSRGHGLTVDRRSTGLVLGVIAVVLGGLFASLLPGFGEPPWYQLQARAATTLTDNPIVQLRTNLVASDTGPIMRVRTDRPVYLRSTALDQYSENEEWTASRIEPRPLNARRVPGATVHGEPHDVRVEVLDLSGAVLVPAPTGPVRFTAPEGVRPLYDERTSTFTFADETLDTGHRYRVAASTPELRPTVADGAPAAAPPRLTALPDQLPDEVGRLARQIVDARDATTPFEQALAIQNELRTWEYSLRPPPGHSGVAMRTFLEQRVGYCEQFAGTMAVMLRTLDIPARVAVGFTPGSVDPDDSTLWTITWANAHAWVEVLLDGQWIAFEPTPRADGNVLVPTAADLAPVETAQAPDETRPDPEPITQDEQFEIFDEREALGQDGTQQSAPSQGDAANGATEVSRRLTDPALAGGVAVTAVLALVVLVGIGRRASGDAGPVARVLSVGEQVDRVGHGLGQPRSVWETDDEYLARLGGDTDASRAVASAITRARYAAEIDADTAAHAERAGSALTTSLLAGRPGWQRALVRMRGDAAVGWQRVRARFRRR
jgi:transglutaminase-like putative cysteine protease